jgi:hypothetical protein
MVATLVFVVAACASAPQSPPATTLPPTPPPPASTTPTIATPPDTTAVPTIEPTAFAFSSALYGYSATAPAGWQAVPGFLRWDGTGSPGHDASEVDKLVAPNGIDGTMIFAISAPTAKSVDAYLSERVDAAAAAHGSCPIESTASVAVSGHPGRLVRTFCSVLIVLVVAVDAGVGYQFTLRDATAKGAGDPDDAALLDAFLRSVRLPG